MAAYSACGVLAACGVLDCHAAFAMTAWRTYAPSWSAAFFRSPAQRLEQYFTLSQSRAHFLRQVKGRPQVAQIFVGRSDFFVNPPRLHHHPDP